MKTNYQWLQLLSVSLCAAALIGCAEARPGSAKHGQITVKPFGQTKDGVPVHLYTLRNSKGSEAGICNYGGLLIYLKVPDRHGQLGDVVLGYNNLDGYLKDTPYFGALIGRYGNRIAKGKFTLEGQEYTLATNNYPNALHGGIKGFDKVVWEPRIMARFEGPALELKYVSKDGEEGYPGNLSVTATYTLTEDNELKLEYTARTDKDTVLNLTHHSYFNLAGKGDILNHVVMIPADKFTPVDSTLIPTGELKPVEGTPFDFRAPTAIGARINDNDEQLKFARRLRRQLGHQQAVGRVGPDGARVRAHQRPGDGGLVQRAGPAVLHGQFPRRHHHGQGRLGLSVSQCLLHGAAALPRLAEQAAIPVRGLEAQPGLPERHHLPVPGAELGHRHSLPGAGLGSPGRRRLGYRRSAIAYRLSFLPGSFSGQPPARGGKWPRWARKKPQK